MFRFKAGNKWARYEDTFWYAAFPREALSHLEHDPQKILFPYVPNIADEEKILQKKYEKMLREQDLEQALIYIHNSRMSGDNRNEEEVLRDMQKLIPGVAFLLNPVANIGGQAVTNEEAFAWKKTEKQEPKTEQKRILE